ncbi:11000_t:CDS:1, partial [Scutellospora calospora]
QLITDTLDNNKTMISREDIIVEIDESKFDKRKYHRSHRVEEIWVVGDIERTDTKKYFVEV